MIRMPRMPSSIGALAYFAAWLVPWRPVFRVCSRRCDVSLFVHRTDVIGRHVAKYGEYEPLLTRLPGIDNVMVSTCAVPRADHVYTLTPQFCRSFRLRSSVVFLDIGEDCCASPPLTNPFSTSRNVPEARIGVFVRGDGVGDGDKTGSQRNDEMPGQPSDRSHSRLGPAEIPIR